MALGITIGLMALLACGGGGSAQQETAEATAVGGGQEATQQQEVQLPEGVTMEMVNQGREIYGGAGICRVCHGTEGEGMPGLGANLTDSEWIHSDGSYEGIIQTVMNGVDGSASTSGAAMAPKGGSGITDDQVKAVAAYVYTLSRRGQ
jgi:mono/diheme cytochrome c family protein